jgi:trans-aconitate methyltransferase
MADTSQTWDPTRYAKNAGFVPQLGLPVLELLTPLAGERILDLGCGDGVLTKKLRDIGVDVKGVDASAEQISAARSAGLDADVVDGHDLDFDREFDAVFSNAALHWMKRPDEVLAGVARALKPGGRFVGEMGGYMNVAALRVACWATLQAREINPADFDPWYFPSPAAYGEKLEQAGFKVENIQLIPRQTPLPGDVRGWLETFCESFLNAVPVAEKKALLNEIAALVEPMLKDEKGNWTADYVRLRFRAVLR